jgi:hypothetical protein
VPGRKGEDVRPIEPGVRSGDLAETEVAALRVRVESLEREVVQLHRRVQPLPAVKRTSRGGKADDPTITRRDLDLIWAQIDEILRVLPEPPTLAAGRTAVFDIEAPRSCT